MSRGIDYMQGQYHARQLFEGSILDARGALAIVSNIELTAPSHPPQYAQGMLDHAARVKRALREVPHG